MSTERFDVLSRDQYGTAYDLRMKRREWLRRQRERERFTVPALTIDATTFSGQALYLYMH